jgi:hypothetical protein
MVDDYLALYRQVAAAHAPVVPLPTERFRVGVNYWPVRRR